MDMNNALSEAMNKPNYVDGDFIGDDGMLHCGKCKTRKQCRFSVPSCNINTLVPCMCKCEQDDYERKEQARKNAENERVMSNNKGDCFTNAMYRKCTFEDDDMCNPDMTRKMKNFATHFSEFHKSGKGVVLHGDVGTGKTYLAACVANHLLENGWRVIMTDFGTIANTLFDAKDKVAALNRYINCDLLVVDDFGTERDTSYMYEQVFTVIDGRYKANKPMLFTSNLSRKQIFDPQDVTLSRIYDRVLERCMPIEFVGANRRKKGLAEKYADINELLSE